MDPYATHSADAAMSQPVGPSEPAPSAPFAVARAATASPQRPPASSRTRRLWPAALTLFLLAPVVGEMLSGSTPPLLFLNPLSLLFQTGLYGSGAILARELVRRRGLGWPNIFVLGAAYGVLEEGLVVTSWFNPHWPDLGTLGSYGRALDINLIWALGLTAYHAVVSIAIPIALTEAFIPTVAARPWLTRRAFRLLAAWLAVVSLLGLLGFGFLAFRKQGYAHPPAAYLLTLALAVALVRVGLRWRPAFDRQSAHRPAPHLWTVRLSALGLMVAFFATLWVFPVKIPFAWMTALAMVGVIALAAWMVWRWSARPGWSRQHQLALASGGLSFFLLLAPLLELGAATHGKPTQGMILVASFFAALLIVLARRQAPDRVRGRVRVTQSYAEYTQSHAEYTQSHAE